MLYYMIDDRLEDSIGYPTEDPKEVPSKEENPVKDKEITLEEIRAAARERDCKS